MRCDGVLVLVLCGCRLGFEPAGDLDAAVTSDDASSADGSAADGSASSADGGASPIANVAISMPAFSTTGMVTAALVTPSTAGTLLVGVLATDGVDFTSVSTMWQPGCTGVNASGGAAAVWFFPANPGGVTSATFNSNGSANLYAQLSEWTVAVAVDQTGMVSGTGTQITVASAGNAAGDLAVTAYELSINPAASVTFSVGAGFTLLGTSGATSRNEHYVASYKLASDATATETMMSSRSGDWAGCIATFRP